MRTKRTLKLVTCIGFFLFISSILTIFDRQFIKILKIDSANVVSSKINENQKIASNTYFGPTDVGNGSAQLIKVELLISDSPVSGGMQIVEVEFNGQTIPLKPRGIDGKRGSASFQLAPGKYQLKWVVNKDRFAWPRNLQKQAEVTINPRDLWIQIEISGESVAIQ